MGERTYGPGGYETAQSILDRLKKDLHLERLEVKRHKYKYKITAPGFQTREGRLGTTICLAVKTGNAPHNYQDTLTQEYPGATIVSSESEANEVVGDFIKGKKAEIVSQYHVDSRKKQIFFSEDSITFTCQEI